jgi:hypothetical protein
MFEKENKEFFRITGFSLYSVLDDTTSVICGKPVIDIEKLDFALKSMVGHYEERGLCMNDVLKERFSAEANDMIDRLLTLD